MAKTMLRVEFQSIQEGTVETVYCLPLDEDNNFIKYVDDGKPMRPVYQVLAHEGYMNTQYYYPVKFFIIKNVSIVED